MFDPWTATIEEAMAEQEKFIASGKELSAPCGQVAQASAAHSVLELKSKIDGGSGFAVLSAVRYCLTHGLVAPDWLARAFNRRYDAVSMYRAGSWDSPLAFGKPFKKGTNIAARRKAKIGRIQVFNAVRDRMRRDPDTAISKQLFEEIGHSLGFGATLTEKYYYEVIKMADENPAKKRKAAGLPKKPK